MKRLTLPFWLTLAAAGILIIQAASPLSPSMRLDDPAPTCPPRCSDPR